MSTIAEAPKPRLVPELPVYGPEVPVLSGEDINNMELIAAEAGTSSALRAVKVNLDLEVSSMPMPDSLAVLLEKTDAELETVADLCGATVLRHAWGLRHDPEHEHEDYHLRKSILHLVPEDHIVVAEVDIIRGALSLASSTVEARYPRTLETVKTGVRQYDKRDRGWLLTDVSYPQFVLNTNEAAVDGLSQPILVDIEPRLEHLD